VLAAFLLLQMDKVELQPPSLMFNTALGQFLKYQLALEEIEVDRLLYLAVPADTYPISLL